MYFTAINLLTGERKITTLKTVNDVGFYNK